jgi:hypothetical protein
LEPAKTSMKLGKKLNNLKMGFLFFGEVDEKNTPGKNFSNGLQMKLN